MTRDTLLILCGAGVGFGVLLGLASAPWWMTWGSFLAAGAAFAFTSWLSEEPN